MKILVRVCTTAEGKSSVSIDQEHGTQKPPSLLPNVGFSRSEKEWQPIQWDSHVVMPTLLNEMLLPIATEAVTQEKKKHDFLQFLLSVRLD